MTDHKRHVRQTGKSILTRLPLEIPFGATGGAVCLQCRQKCCIGSSGVPFLTAYDVAKLRRATGPSIERVIRENRHPSLGRHYNVLADDTGGKCPFLTPESECGIYANRPLDCHLFPLDLHVEDGELIWIAYTHCDLQVDSVSETTEYVLSQAEEELLPLFTPQELRLFATANDFDLFQRGVWRRLRPVRLRKRG